MRLFVDVTHSQNSGHPCSSPVLRCFERVVISKTLSRASGKMRNLFPVIPHYWIERRSIILPIGLGLRAVCTQGDDNFGSFVKKDRGSYKTSRSTYYICVSTLCQVLHSIPECICWCCHIS